MILDILLLHVCILLVSQRVESSDTLLQLEDIRTQILIVTLQVVEFAFQVVVASFGTFQKSHGILELSTQNPRLLMKLLG